VDTVSHLSVKPQERWALFVQVMIAASSANRVMKCISEIGKQYAMAISVASNFLKLFKKGKKYDILYFHGIVGEYLHLKGANDSCFRCIFCLCVCCFLSFSCYCTSFSGKFLFQLFRTVQSDRGK